ncbi:hypothetical protein [Virgibacillus sp. SK37]|uniref:hypothetical protein n=1 Tax=Virgibacillus sp. SK37 TaxID=403957 RepID=UPI0004D14277|nr:hypothetical protein [Virgibacillus sp. SK37]AIF45337.1 hypothetical protein X953_07355 [Virgibacillus sp. SK37]
MKRNLLSIAFLLITLFAAYLGLFAQDIAYYFADHLFNVSPFQVLIIVTLTSIGIFLMVFLAEMIILVRQQVKSILLKQMLFTNALIWIFVSVWSWFVLAMWWG